MAPRFALLPTDLASAHALILAERAARLEAEADAAQARAVNTSTEALIAHLKLEIEKLQSPAALPDDDEWCPHCRMSVIRLPMIVNKRIHGVP